MNRRVAIISAAALVAVLAVASLIYWVSRPSKKHVAQAPQQNQQPHRQETAPAPQPPPFYKITIPNDNLSAIAIRLYGNVNAIDWILKNNPGITDRNYVQLYWCIYVPPMPAAQAANASGTPPVTQVSRHDAPNQQPQMQPSSTAAAPQPQPAADEQQPPAQPQPANNDTTQPVQPAKPAAPAKPATQEKQPALLNASLPSSSQPADDMIVTVEKDDFSAVMPEPAAPLDLQLEEVAAVAPENIVVPSLPFSTTATAAIEPAVAAAPATAIVTNTPAAATHPTAIAASLKQGKAKKEKPVIGYAYIFPTPEKTVPLKSPLETRIALFTSEETRTLGAPYQENQLQDSWVDIKDKHLVLYVPYKGTLPSQQFVLEVGGVNHLIDGKDFTAHAIAIRGKFPQPHHPLQALLTNGGSIGMGVKVFFFTGGNIPAAVAAVAVPRIAGALISRHLRNSAKKVEIARNAVLQANSNAATAAITAAGGPQTPSTQTQVKEALR